MDNPPVDPISAAQPPPPPPPRSGLGGGAERPWWGMGDIALALPFVFLVAAIGGTIAVVVARLFGAEIDANAELPVYALVIGVLFQQLAQGGFPAIVSNWKGEGMAPDWKWGFSLPADIKNGVGLAFACVVASSLVSAAVAALISLPEDANPSNTGIITDNQGSPWLIALILLITIGAPLSEELLFRGLVLRAIEKRFGSAIAIVGSSLIFALPHLQGGATAKETIVLLSGITVVGLILALGAVRSNRLGGPIIGHLLFNVFGTVVTLVG